MFPFKVISKDSKPCIEVDLKEGKKVFQAEEISAMILIKMKETAEAYLGRDIKNAVVTVPGEFFFSLLDVPRSHRNVRRALALACMTRRLTV
jgi:molecular chaperone DnaK (HSP70)